MRILLVEDSDFLRPMFARILRGRGFEVRETCDGLEALLCLEEFRPDLVLTDLMMPVLDGVELIKRLRGIPGLETVPVVVISAMQSAAMENEARLAGAADVITKPVDSDDLVNRIIRYL
jgi:CheY-like chemotaxis protein